MATPRVALPARELLFPRGFERSQTWPPFKARASAVRAYSQLYVQVQRSSDPGKLGIMQLWFVASVALALTALVASALVASARSVSTPRALAESGAARLPLDALVLHRSVFYIYCHTWAIRSAGR